MDGTLLNSNNEISSRTKEALLEAKARGVHVVLATGRMLKSALNYSNRLDLNRPIIASNGSIIVDENQNIIYKNTLNEDQVRDITDIGKELELYYHFYTEEALYSPFEEEEITKFYNHDSTEEEWIHSYVFKDIEDILDRKDLEIYKFIFLDSDERRYKLNELEEKLNSLNNLNITTSWKNNLEVMNEEVSKGNSLKFLCEKLGVNREEVIAIGDNNNDISMIEFAGLGVAMKNGEAEVHSKADIITEGTNDEDGVAEIIEKYILSRRER